jgi:outer membrane PBP1 activator LpoA protein
MIPSSHAFPSPRTDPPCTDSPGTHPPRTHPPGTDPAGARRARRGGATVLAAALLCIALSACQSGGGARVDDDKAERVARALLGEGRPTEAAYEYLRLAREASPDRARYYRLSAVEALLEGGDVASAGRILDADLSGAMPQPDAYRRDLARAELALLGRDPALALELAGNPPAEVTPALSLRAGRLRARALSRVGNHLEAARTLLGLEPLMATPDGAERNRIQAWHELARVSQPALERARLPPPDVFGGWVELAIVVTGSFMDADTFATRLAAWQGRYEDHPAMQTIVPQLVQDSATQGRAPVAVALLLPLDGPFGDAARAVRDGFLAAWYADDPIGRPAVLVRDSSGDDIWPVYRAAVEEGAELVVGPLRRQSVTALASVEAVPVPTLALNHATAPDPVVEPETTLPPGATALGMAPDIAPEMAPEIAIEVEQTSAGVAEVPPADAAQPILAQPAAAQPAAPGSDPAGAEPGAPTDGLFQFALSPEEEAQQVAEHAWFGGHGQAAVIAPQGEWGERVSGAFIEAWESLGGEVVASTAYQGQAVDLSAPVAALLNVDASKQRFASLRRIVGSGLMSEARRRQDVDMVFMAGFPRHARQLRPQFKFHHAADLPVFSTSHVFTGVVDEGADRDIDGVNFGDMPWAIGGGEQTALRRRVEALWPETMASYLRLYAFGADAYALVSRIGRLRAQPSAGYQGATGRLSVGTDNRVRRRLTWARFQDGRPVPTDEGFGSSGIPGGIRTTDDLGREGSVESWRRP